MSNNVNTDLLERAAEMVEFWEGNKIADEVQSALNSNDLDLVRKYTLDAEAEAARREIHGYGLMPELEPRQHVFERSQWSDNCVCADCYGDFSGASNEDR